MLTVTSKIRTTLTILNHNMNKIIALLIAALFLTNVNSESMDDYLVNMVVGEQNCKNYLFHGSRKIIYFENNNYRDSAIELNNSLEKYCGLNEQVFRYRWLVDAIGNKSIEGEERILLDYLIHYRNRINWTKENRSSVENVRYRFNYWADPNFDSLTVKMAASINAGNNKDLKLIKYAYSNDFVAFGQNLTSESTNSFLAREAEDRRNNAHAGARITASLFGGGWFPTSNLSKVNEHPYFGFKFGGGYNRINANFRVGLIMPNGPYDYQVVFENNLVNADNFGGVAVGIEPSFDILQMLNWKVAIVGAVAGTWVISYSATSTNPTSDPKTTSLYSPEYSIGMKVDWLWGSGGTVGIEARYNYLDFSNKGGSNLDGNSLILLIHFGVEGSPKWWRAKEIWK